MTAEKPQGDGHTRQHAIDGGVRGISADVVRKPLDTAGEEGLMKGVVQQKVSAVCNGVNGSIDQVELAWRLESDNTGQTNVRG